ncbi:MAG: hypothetical protein ACRDO7_02820 [Nocardioidaceae bacterium]
MRQILSARDRHDLELMRISMRSWKPAFRAVEKQVEAAGYDQIAGELDTERRRAAARRRRPSWADE